MSAPPQPPYSDDEDDYEDEEEEVTASAVTSNRLQSFLGFWDSLGFSCDFTKSDYSSTCVSF